MGDTFGGEHHRPKNPTRGHSPRELRQRASFDNEPAVGCGAMVLIATILTTAATTVVRRRK